MKPSRFNVLVDVDPRGPVVHNTESARSLVVPLPVAKWLEIAGKSPLPSALYPGRFRNLLPELARGGFIVEDDIDELQVQIHRRRMGRFSSDRCIIMVQLLTACNLRCHYCIQTYAPRRKRMTLDMADRLVGFAKNMVAESRARLLVMTMYGGEPFMNHDAMLRIMEQMHEYEKHHMVQINMPVVTNGMLLTKHADSRVLELAAGFHITFDGGPGRHDTIRKQADGAGSYEQIMRGIAMLRERDIRVRVRLHVNQLTKDGLLALLDDLYAAGIVPNRWHCDMYWSQSEDASEFETYEACVKERGSNWEAAREHVFSLYEAAKEHPLGAIIDPGFNPSPRATNPLFAGDAHWRPRPSEHCSGCPLDSVSSVYVTPDGGLWSCPDDPRPEARMGQLEPGGVAWGAGRTRLLTRDYWPDKACAECEYLPVCGGGCPLDRPDELDKCDTRKTKRKNVEAYIRDSPPQEAGIGTLPIYQSG